MNVTNWNDWMVKNHIKLKGNDSNDNGTNEKCAGRGISGTKMETQSTGHGRPSGNRHI